ncbi:phosphatase PAP2 family protein [Kaistia dalseonensis]|uniref:Undecaprenyl-diphosphatase n=1 Tax=Kaistia dalseonensis TaxID=410840 RepID=A0ABU0H1P1_9HYPH|nr:phosphatase PAP2 family protein [Kaistia dalseonensis]MCX5493659.1 phosphatase PAP2 family protein [Kaistia dalseonensis]MDQ0436221.1 undecaprenyl-diphosphatase [Kaistia dalseonensis]
MRSVGARRFAVINERIGANLTAIGARITRYRERPAINPSALRRSEIAVLTVFSLLVVLAVGLAFDRLSVERAREVPAIGRWFFGLLTELGLSAWELYPAGILVLLLLFGRWSMVPRRVAAFWAEIGAFAAYIFGAIAGSGIALNIAKQFIGRGRPGTFDEYGALVLRPFRFSYEFQSFPSGHSATAGALIAIGFLVVPRLRIWLMALALGIAASRVVVGAHYPSDIVGGLLFGYVFSLWLAGRFAAAGWAFARGPEGLIRARAAAITYVFDSPARIIVVIAGLIDALIGRRVWIPALLSIGDGSHGVPRIQRDRADDI